MIVVLIATLTLSFVPAAQSQEVTEQTVDQAGFQAPEFEVPAFAEADTDGFDELDPFDPNVEQTLEMMDWLYEFQTGQKAIIDGGKDQYYATCYRQTCPVWILVDKSSQRAYVYINGNPAYTWLVSTGTAGHGTPNFDQHPNGRIYDRYTSTKYPGGDWNGLGNMPYAVFIQGGFAIHGTGRGNWSKLGRRASHGCIRLHPDNGYIFNRLVRQYGIYKTWITVQ